MNLVYNYQNIETLLYNLYTQCSVRGLLHSDPGYLFKWISRLITPPVKFGIHFFLPFVSPRAFPLINGLWPQRMIILRVLCIKFINHKKLFKLIFLSKYLVPGFYGECRFSLAVRSIILLRKSISHNNPTITSCKSVLKIRK